MKSNFKISFMSIGMIVFTLAIIFITVVKTSEYVQKGKWKNTIAVVEEKNRRETGGYSRYNRSSVPNRNVYYDYRYEYKVGNDTYFQKVVGGSVDPGEKFTLWYDPSNPKNVESEFKHVFPWMMYIFSFVMAAITVISLIHDSRNGVSKITSKGMIVDDEIRWYQ